MELLTTKQAERLSGASFRQIDFWDRSAHVIRPAVPARGSGTQRRWSEAQVACLAVMAELARLGCPCAVLAAVVEALEWNETLWDGLVCVSADGDVRPVANGLSCGWVVDAAAALRRVLPAQRKLVA